MAYQDSGGNKFTNHSAMKTSEAKLKAKGPSQTPQPSDNDGDEPNNAAAMVQQHGPAMQIDIQHGQGQSLVHATHADGHSHETQHASVDEAHKFAHAVAGGMQ